MHNCSVNAYCFNTIGSYKCTCLFGFHGDGMSCQDIEECTGNMHYCSTYADCYNTIGSYYCSCLAGFHGNGMSCQDVDECKYNVHNCSVHARCNNTVGSYHCTCLEENHGDGMSCQDVDECKDNVHNCSGYAHCNNTIALALTIAHVLRDSMEMESHVKTLMNAKIICTIAVCMRAAITLLAPIIVTVLKNSMQTACHVRILMNSKTMCTIVVFMHAAITLLALMTALVSQPLKEMAGLAMTSMNARTVLISASHKQHAQTLKALMNAAAFLGFVVMVKCVEISRNVWMDHMQLVRTLWDPIPVHAMMASMAMVVYAPTSMNASLEVISVIFVPANKPGSCSCSCRNGYTGNGRYCNSNRAANNFPAGAGQIVRSKLFLLGHISFLVGQTLGTSYRSKSAPSLLRIMFKYETSKFSKHLLYMSSDVKCRTCGTHEKAKSVSHYFVRTTIASVLRLIYGKL